MDIKTLRKAKGLTQAELADMTGMTQGFLSDVERGKANPTLDKYKQIAEALNVALMDLFADDRQAAEQRIIEAYRMLPPDQRKGWEDMAKVYLAQDPARQE